MYTTPDASRRTAVKIMITDTLGEDYQELSLRKLSVSEHLQGKKTTIDYEFFDGAQIIEINDAPGMGAADAFFKSIIAHYRDFSSIQPLQLKSFEVKADLPRSQAGTDAKVLVGAEFCNGRQSATFTASDYSIVTACCKCVLDSVEYFLNSELAFKKMKMIIQDAKSRNRSDIVSKYEYRLASLVNSNIAFYEGV
ncbi:MAG: hypothetical protein HOJ16_07550 [Candidatus Peribacter sp.]|nr:hypothetical protein [Candidatus Peribacter sp.]